MGTGVGNDNVTPLKVEGGVMVTEFTPGFMFVQ